MICSTCGGDFIQTESQIKRRSRQCSDCIREKQRVCQKRFRDKNAKPRLLVDVTVCRACNNKFKPLDWQIKKSDRLCRNCRVEYFRNYRKTNEKEKARSRNYFRTVRDIPKERQKRLAREKVQRALRSGKIKREPCLICGNEISEAHHEDYTKPLEIIWLCKEHHIQADNARRERERAA